MLQVAVGVVKNQLGEILIALRQPSSHQGGLWEFPGGKLEAGETALQALTRELYEEVGIKVQVARPLIKVKHQYPELAVQLHVFVVDQFSGQAQGQEGQVCQWVALSRLDEFCFPAANRPIISAARLPAYYAILDEVDKDQVLQQLHHLLDHGIRLIQARLKNLSAEASAALIKQLYPVCKAVDAQLLVNSVHVDVEPSFTDGLHLTSQHLVALSARPEGYRWVAASCHNLAELHHAQTLGLDFVVLAPVMPSLSHPDRAGLGWGQFAACLAEVNLPVYALGGMAKADLATAQAAGGQGIAAIRAFLD